LNECHGHIILGGENFRQCIDQHANGVNRDVIRTRLELCKNSRITFFRDGGDNKGASEYAAAVAGEYGIDYRTPIYAIHKNGCYGKFLGFGFEDMDEFKKLAQSVVQRHGNFIKIMASGILDFNSYGVVTPGSPTFGELQYMVSFCHDMGYRVMAHCSGRENVRRAVLAGCDSIEHGFYIDSETIAAMVEKDIIWVPTAAPVANLIGKGKFDDAVLSKIMSEHYAAIKKAHLAGCLIAPGSDLGSGMVYPGKGTAQEYEYLTFNAGLTVSDLDKAAQEIKKRF
jgi:imidazolonepropionase-like amidohydrolase